METPSSTLAPDGTGEVLELETELLCALALGGADTGEIHRFLEGASDQGQDLQAMALMLANRSLNEADLRLVFEKLKKHQQILKNRLGREVGIRTAALDYLEILENHSEADLKGSRFTFHQMAHMAFFDSLTDLPNYRSLTAHLEREFKRAHRYQHPLSFMMLDIDHFKEFNDRFGHPNGNMALAALSGAIKEVLRETDILGRYGGEEFALILAETAKPEAWDLAERIRMKVEKTPVNLPEFGPRNLTVSLGLATYPRDARNAEEVLKAADEALYLAKKSGRNRVRFYIPPTSVRLFYKPAPAENIMSLHVIGDFNGWSIRADPMVWDGGQKCFQLLLHLAPGRYKYKFIANKDWYLNDPFCPESEMDGLGGRNSILKVDRLDALPGNNGGDGDI